jgi:hypothetical protein
VARPTKLTDDLRQRVADYLRAGNPIDTAVRACDLAPSTHYEWMGKAEALEHVDPAALRGKALNAALAKAGLPKDGTAPEKRARIAALRRYRESVLDAIAASEATAVLRIASAAKDDWRAAAWMLERTYPERWAKPPRGGGRPAKPPPPDPDETPEPEEPDGDQAGL